MSNDNKAIRATEENWFCLEMLEKKLIKKLMVFIFLNQVMAMNLVIYIYKKYLKYHLLASFPQEPVTYNSCSI